ncbi:MAG: hypothetical protein M5U14_00465 [Acidimicrobiia bacterium]|nr:hypothetical protein [Acidimicrobiia bacterium]
MLAAGLGAFAVSVIVRQVVTGVGARRRAHGEGLPVALGRMVAGNPRLYGGLIVHLGVVLVALALAASGSGTRREVRLAPNESATVEGYRLTFLGTERAETAQKTTVSVRVRVERGDRDLGVYAPAVSTFPNSTQGIGTPSVRTGLVEDLYLTLVSSPNEQGRVTLGVAVNPLVLWLWVGGGVMALGTIVAVGPGLGRRLRGRRATAPAAPAPEPSPAREEVPV